MLDREHMIKQVYEHAYRRGKHRHWLYDFIYEHCGETRLSQCTMEQLGNLIVKMREICPLRRYNKKAKGE